MTCTKRFSENLQKNGLPIEDIEAIRQNAEKLVEEAEETLNNDAEKLGLLFGQVQSGKTNNIIMSVANFIDKGYKLFIILTSDNTWLYGQTLSRIQNGLRNVAVFGKDDWRNTDMRSRIQTSYTHRAVIFVSTKNRAILDSLTSFVCGITKHSDTAIIYDDEADQASLDTNQNRDDVLPSAINSSIQQMRNYFDNHIFVQVTATPQALFLQSATKAFRPAFVVPISPGSAYIGGEFFFEPSENSPMRLIQDSEPDAIIQSGDDFQGSAIPTGLRQALCSFFISAAMKNLDGDDSAFACLVHISHRQGIHQILQKIINSFLEVAMTAICEKTEMTDIIVQFFKEAYQDLNREKKYDFHELMNFIISDIYSTNVQILNSDNPELPETSSAFNILIGGNRLGRGVTIGRLLVTYYGRSSKTPQIDTVMQHARMYGYRKKDATNIRFFTTSALFDIFTNIYESDIQLRKMIFSDSSAKMQAILLNRTHNSNLRPTRNSVIPLEQIVLFLPGTRYFPYSPKTVNVDILNVMLEQYNGQGLKSVDIDFLIQILMLTESEKLSGESWDDEAVRVCLKNMKEKYDNHGYLFVAIDRDIKRGARAMLSANDVGVYNANFPTLTIYRYSGSTDKGWDGQPLWVPNLRFPDGNEFYMYTPS